MKLEEGIIPENNNNGNLNQDQDIEKPLFGNYDIVEEESTIAKNRNRRKNRQRTDDSLALNDVFETLPDQSHSETISHQKYHKNPSKHQLHNFHSPSKLTNDIRLEIPISLDATISLPKNKQSLEELLDFVMTHDATIMQEYLKNKLGSQPQVRIANGTFGMETFLYFKASA